MNTARPSPGPARDPAGRPAAGRKDETRNEEDRGQLARASGPGEQAAERGPPPPARPRIAVGLSGGIDSAVTAVIAAMHKAVDEMAVRETFKGYGPEQGYEWLRAAIAQNDFRDHGLDVADDEIFVSDGSKCDCGSILDILGSKNKIAISDPVYPVYVDTNVMAGHTGPANEAGAYGKIVYLPCTPRNGFTPSPDQVAP